MSFLLIFRTIKILPAGLFFKFINWDPILLFQQSLKSKMISNDQELMRQELMQSDPTSCPQNTKGNN